MGKLFSNFPGGDVLLDGHQVFNLERKNEKERRKKMEG